jgi:hypothetical protein
MSKDDDTANSMPSVATRQFDMDEPLTGTLSIHPERPDGGTVIHRDGNHECVGRYGYVRDGENLAGRTVVALRSDGTYQQLPTGAPPHGRGGPSTAATPAYRDGWDRVFGSKGVN